MIRTSVILAHLSQHCHQHTLAITFLANKRYYDNKHVYVKPERTEIGISTSGAQTLQQL